MHRKLLAVATATALTLGALITPSASAVTIQFNGAPATDAPNALRAIASAFNSVRETGATLSAGGYKVVYDPRTLGEEQAEAFVPAETANDDGSVTIQHGQTTDGRKVVTPAAGKFTSGFGPRWGTVHRGIDIANNLGTPISAVMDGTVINAGPAQGFGNWVVIRHDGGEVSVYGHMRYYNVSVGERVTAGQQIAVIGSEGQSTGPHLHFEIKPDGVNQVDPVPWFKAQGITI